MIYSLFYRHNSFCTVFWVSSFYLSVNIVVLYQFAITCIENFADKVEVWGLSDRLRLLICFRVVEDVPEKKGMDLWKQMSSSKCSFTCTCGVFLPLNPSMTTVYARSAFYPSLRFTLSLQSAFYTQSAFYPWSAVCSPQSAVFVLHWLIFQFPRTYYFVQISQPAKICLKNRYFEEQIHWVPLSGELSRVLSRVFEW